MEATGDYWKGPAACFERGAVTSCFVATGEFRVIRLHTRYRRDLTDERTRDKQPAEKLLESAAIKLSSVVPATFSDPLSRAERRGAPVRGDIDRSDTRPGGWPPG